MSGSTDPDDFARSVCRVVQNIPVGHVMSYGDVAASAGFAGRARMVSRAMGRCEEVLPWFRVVRSDLSLAFPVGSEMYDRQRGLLEEEGVRFERSRIPERYRAILDLDALIWGE